MNRKRRDGVGLCGRCIHSKVVENRRGSRFYLCRRSVDDGRFPRYPRLPVVSCPGFEVQDETGAASTETG